MADNPRIEELRRRVQADPASIAFAALAEEYRRIGQFEDAIDTCRIGLQRHPSYLSARVTLGRSLIAIGDNAAARVELETVLKAAPENLAAIRAMAEIHGASEQSPTASAGAAAQPVSPPPAPSPSPAASAAPNQLAAAPVAPPAPLRPPAIPIRESRPAVPVAPIPVSGAAPAPSSRASLTPEPRPAASVDRETVDRATLQRAATIQRLESFLASIEAARAAVR